MEVILTGANGLLGSRLLRDGKENFNVRTLKWKEILDLSSEDLSEKIERADLIIHAAANTNVEYCEENVEESYLSNTYLTKKLLKSKGLNTRFVYISSTGIYGNQKKDPYNEHDDVKPTTAHHKAKHESERLVMLNSRNHIIIRTGWLYGDLSKNDFVSKIINNIPKNRVMYANIDQFGCPSYTKDVSERIIEIIKAEASGIFNVVNFGCVSRYEFIKEIIKLFKMDVEVIPANKEQFKRKANVSDNECAVSIVNKDFNFTDLRDWKLALQEFIDNLNGI